MMTLKSICNQGDKKIKRRDVKIDEEKVNKARKYNDVNYCWFCYFEGKKFDPDKRINYKEVPSENKSTFEERSVCFSGLIDRINKRQDSHPKSKYNRLFCKSIYRSKSTFLTSEQVEEWIELSKKHKMLPEYIKADHINQSESIVFNISELLPPMLYIYLCTYRNIYEHPGFTIIVSYLIHEFDMNYYIAYVVASKLCFIYGKGHHPIYTTAFYGKPKKQFSEIEIPVKDMIGLCRFVSNPGDYIKTNNAEGFNCGYTIDHITKIDKSFTSRELINPLITKAVLAEDDKKSNGYIEEFDKEKERYIYA